MIFLIWPKDEFTRFEVSRLVGARSLQISLGAPILTKSDKASPIDIAKEEFKEQIIPITIKRTLPDGTLVTVEAKSAIKNWVAKYKEI